VPVNVSFGRDGNNRPSIREAIVVPNANYCPATMPFGCNFTLSEELRRRQRAGGLAADPERKCHQD
jgi:hypothetical protein